MIRIILSGCGGNMGHVLTKMIAKKKDCSIVAGINIRTDLSYEYPVFSKASDVTVDADVLIDFSNPALLPSLLEIGIKKKLPLVLCTTGYSEEQVKEIQKVSQFISIFYSRNMSIGINLLVELSKKAAAILGTHFDVEIIEKHHNQKIDAPSGTALMLADGIASVKSDKMDYIYDRHLRNEKRKLNEIGLHSVRGGSIIGEHEVLFAGPQEVITLSHSALSRDIFAHGAIEASIYLSSQTTGMHDMSDLLKCD